MVTGGATIKKLPLTTQRTASALRSGPRTDERPRTGPDRSHLGPDHGLGPALIVQGAVSVLTFLHRIKDRLRTGPDWSFRYNVGITFR